MKIPAISIIRPTLMVLSILCFAILAEAETSAPSDSGLPEVEEQLIDAGPYHLFFRIIRGQGPVVLLESGGGMDSTEWTDLAPRIAQETGATVVFYDRPGFGQSDLPDIPCDMREESTSLWRALSRLGLDDNVVCVGHSYGGWMIRLHANDYPDKVAGLVFVDPFNCKLVDALGLEYCDQHPMMGKLPFDTSDPNKLTREQKALVRMVGQGLGPKMTVMRDTKIKAGTQVRWITSKKPFLLSNEEAEAWWLSHDQTLASIPGAVQVIATESGHMIPWDQPDLVLDEIRTVIAALPQIIWSSQTPKTLPKTKTP